MASWLTQFDLANEAKSVSIRTVSGMNATGRVGICASILLVCQRCGKKGVANVLGKDKRINHRFTRVSVQEPEYDSVCMLVRPDERIIFENRAARPDAKVVMILRR